MRLYELTSEYELLLQLAANEGGENPEGGPDLLMAVENIEAQIEAKCFGIGKVLAQLDAEAQAFAREAERLAKQHEVRAQSAARLREYVRVNLRDRGITKVQGETFTFALVQCPERVEVDDEAQVPEVFKRRKVTESCAVDKKAVLAAWKSDGECIPGTRVVRDVRLSIK